jgi:hypothetical protein
VLLLLPVQLLGGGEAHLFGLEEKADYKNQNNDLSIIWLLKNRDLAVYMVYSSGSASTYRYGANGL